MKEALKVFYQELIKCIIHQRLFQLFLSLFIIVSFVYEKFYSCLVKVKFYFFIKLFWIVFYSFSFVTLILIPYLVFLIYKKDFLKIREIFIEQKSVIKFNSKNYFFRDFIIIFSISIFHILYYNHIIPLPCIKQQFKFDFYSFIFFGVLIVNFISVLFFIIKKNVFFRILLLIILAGINYFYLDKNDFSLIFILYYFVFVSLQFLIIFLLIFRKKIFYEDRINKLDICFLVYNILLTILIITILYLLYSYDCFINFFKCILNNSPNQLI